MRVERGATGHCGAQAALVCSHRRRGEGVQSSAYASPRVTRELAARQPACNMRRYLGPPAQGGCRRVRCARAQRAPGGHESQPAVAATRDGASFCTNIHSRRRAIWDRTQSAAMSNAREPSWAAQIEPSRIRERSTQRVPSRQPRGELIDRADPMPARIGDGQSSHSRGSHRRAFGDLAHQSPFISAPAHE